MLANMLQNEKYKVDALMQQGYTVDFLTQKRIWDKSMYSLKILMIGDIQFWI